MDCIFCKISNGEIPCYKIYEDESIIAFLDVNPKCNGHTLVVPKEHFQDVYEIPEVALLYLETIGKKIAKDLMEKLSVTGITFMMNYGTSQEVKHIHLHILPNFDKKQTIEDVEKIYKKIME